MWLQNKLKKGLASLLTWKNNVRRFALSVIISITILNFMMPYVAEAQELEGEAYAPSGSSFDTQTNLWSIQKDVPENRFCMHRIGRDIVLQAGIQTEDAING